MPCKRNISSTFMRRPREEIQYLSQCSGEAHSFAIIDCLYLFSYYHWLLIHFRLFTSLFLEQVARPTLEVGSHFFISSNEVPCRTGKRCPFDPYLYWMPPGLGSHIVLHTCVCVCVCASVSMCQLQKADLKCPSQTNRATWCQAAKVQANLDDESASS